MEKRKYSLLTDKEFNELEKGVSAFAKGFEDIVYIIATSTQGNSKDQQMFLAQAFIQNVNMDAQKQRLNFIHQDMPDE